MASQRASRQNTHFIARAHRREPLSTWTHCSAPPACCVSRASSPATRVSTRVEASNDDNVGVDDPVEHAVRESAQVRPPGVAVDNSMTQRVVQKTIEHEHDHVAKDV